MKDLKSYIIESSKTVYDMFEQDFYTISEFKDGENVFIGWINDEGQAIAIEVVVKKHNDDIIFVNPDDDRDMIEYKDCIYISKGKDIKICMCNALEDMEEICSWYNEHK